MSGLEENKMEENGKMQEKERLKPVHMRRVGTVTCGLTLILYGILFLVHTVAPKLNYTIIFRMWPVILILLGAEILFGAVRGEKEKNTFIYDFPAVLLIIVMAFFVMIMALVDYGLTTGHIIWQEGYYYGI